MQLKLKPVLLTVTVAVLLGLSIPLAFLFGCLWASYGVTEVKKLRIAIQGQQFPVPSPLEGVHHIVCLGDSITEQGEKEYGYVGLLRAYFAALFPKEQITVKNAGISGNASHQMLARFDRDVLQCQPKPDLVTINAGLNDVAQKGERAVEEYSNCMQAMTEKAKAAGMKVVLLSPTMYNETLQSPQNKILESCTDSLKQIANKNKAQYIDIREPFKLMLSDYRSSTGGNELIFTTDGMHLNTLGNRVVANTIMSHLGITSEMRASVE